MGGCSGEACYSWGHAPWGLGFAGAPSQPSCFGRISPGSSAITTTKSRRPGRPCRVHPVRADDACRPARASVHMCLYKLEGLRRRRRLTGPRFYGSGYATRARRRRVHMSSSYRPVAAPTSPFLSKVHSRVPRPSLSKVHSVSRSPVQGGFQEQSECEVWGEHGEVTSRWTRQRGKGPLAPRPLRPLRPRPPPPLLRLRRRWAASASASASALLRATLRFSTGARRPRRTAASARRTRSRTSRRTARTESTTRRAEGEGRAMEGTSSR